MDKGTGGREGNRGKKWKRHALVLSLAVAFTLLAIAIAYMTIPPAVKPVIEFNVIGTEPESVYGAG